MRSRNLKKIRRSHILHFRKEYLEYLKISNYVLYDRNENNSTKSCKVEICLPLALPRPLPLPPRPIPLPRTRGDPSAIADEQISVWKEYMTSYIYSSSNLSWVNTSFIFELNQWLHLVFRKRSLIPVIKKDIVRKVLCISTCDDEIKGKECVL